MDIFANFSAIPALVVIVYLLAEGVKLIQNGKFSPYIPVFCGACGGILSLLAFIFCPSFVGAETIFDALAIGIVSGFSATGVNQVFKQLKN